MSLSPTERRGWLALLALGLAYAGLFAAFYPPLSGIEDEVGFVNQALVWSRGALSAEGAGYPSLGDFELYKGRHVATRHPGRSLVALPFLMAAGVRGVFASGLLLHLGMTAAAGVLLSRLGRSPLWAALVLFHPTLSLYSRTMLADGTAGAGLLLAALATTLPRGAGVFSGLAVVLAAAMRAHAGMVLPIVAASLRFPPRHPRPWREAALCLVAGVMGGSLLMAYNQVVYGTWVDPFSAKRGFFSAQFLVPHGLFYAACLMVLWPGMLLAPVLDRSPIRWLVRGVCGIYFLLFSAYYFHDDSTNLIETLVVGQRLIQVALPLWIVSYAGVVDDRLAAPLSLRLGRRTWTALVAVGCVGLLAGNAAMFARHQSHLLRLRAVRDAVATHVPEGSLLIQVGAVHKLFGVPVGLPTYRIAALDFNGQPLDVSADIAAQTLPWYLVLLDSPPGVPLPERAQKLVEDHHLTELSLGVPRLRVFKSPAPALPAGKGRE